MKAERQAIETIRVYILESSPKQTMTRPSILAALDLLTAALDRAERAEKRLAVLEDERKMGNTPHKCLNPECGTTAYGTGYKVCPGCGGVDGRAALASGETG